MSTPSSRFPSESEPQPTTEPDESADSGGLPRLRGVALPFRAVNRLRPRDLTPALRVRVIGPSGVSIPLWGVVDSGATRTLLPLSIAGPLGIRKRKCRKESIDTAGGWARQYVWADGLEIEFPDLGGSRIEVDGAFNKNLHALVLLGRKDFFARFRVSIDQPARLLGLEEHTTP
jgi:hypothetical protein